MKSSDFRKEARNKLDGKWGKAVGIMLCFMLISIVFEIIEKNAADSIKAVVSLIEFVIDVPLSFGLISTFLKLYEEQETTPFGFFNDGLDNIGKSWGIAFYTFIKLIVPFILMIVAIFIIIGGAIGGFAGLSSIFTMEAPNELVSTFSASFGLMAILGAVLYLVAIIWLTCESYYYSLAMMIGAKNENLTSKECVEKSKELMKGNRAKYFWLQLSFIGWAILAVFTLGIGFLWLTPYMHVASIAFYKHLEGDNGQINVTE